MSLASFVNFMEERFHQQIASRSRSEPSAGEFADLPEELNPKLAEALRAAGIPRLARRAKGDRGKA